MDEEMVEEDEMYSPPDQGPAQAAIGKGESTDQGPDQYEAFAEEAMKVAATGPSDDDCDAITARIVEKLKAKGMGEGQSEEALFSQARKIYWDWKDSKRKAEKSGQDEYLDTNPMGEI